MVESDHKAILERKLEELFPNPVRRAEAVKLLEEYGKESYEREADRVKLAVLKLSGKKLEKIRLNVETAKKDYRDVLAYAEYPNQFAHDSWNLTEKQNKTLIDTDRKQYVGWLNKHAKDI